MVQSVKLGRLFTSVLLLFVSLEGAELVGHVTVMQQSIMGCLPEAEQHLFYLLVNISSYQPSVSQ